MVAETRTKGVGGYADLFSCMKKSNVSPKTNITNPKIWPSEHTDQANRTTCLWGTTVAVMVNNAS